jgi:hypothetical protein
MTFVTGLRATVEFLNARWAGRRRCGESDEMFSWPRLLRARSGMFLRARIWH